MFLKVSSALFNETFFPESPGNRHPFSRDSQRSGKTQFPGKFSNPGIPDFNPTIDMFCSVKMKMHNLTETLIATF